MNRILEIMVAGSNRFVEERKDGYFDANGERVGGTAGGIVRLLREASRSEAIDFENRRANRYLDKLVADLKAEVLSPNAAITMAYGAGCNRGKELIP